MMFLENVRKITGKKVFALASVFPAKKYKKLRRKK